MSAKPPPLIGVFDSGLGGLSVLKALHQQLPSANFLYFADSAHAPYGERDDDFILSRTHRVASHLIAQGAKLLVIACNTASAVAASSVRKRWPELHIVAVEPGVKPAVAATRNGRVGVMATPATLRSAKFAKLTMAHKGNVELHLQACPGLAGQIEISQADSLELLALVERFVAPLRDAAVDTVVLGCTHYPFVSRQIEAAFATPVVLIDTADAVARQAVRCSSGSIQQGNLREGKVRLQTSGSTQRLESFALEWLPLRCAIESAPGI